VKIPDKVYDVLKWTALIALPALATFYSIVGKVWGWPYIGEVTTTITALGTLIGALIGLSTLSYNKDK
jgi:hypothetical protein